MNPLVAFRILILCKTHGFSHLHTHDSHSHTFAVVAVGLLGVDVPLVVHRRVDFPIKNNFLSRWKYNHPSVRAIICVSHFIKKLIEPSLKNPNIVHAIHSGIGLGQKKELSKTNLRTEFNVPDGHFIVINLAALAPHKDYFTFVNTAGILLEKGLPAKFLLVGGDGGEQENIRRFIQKKGLQNDLVLTGFRTDIQAILAQADLLLFTSKTEGLGSAVLDALKAGVPIVATAAGGVPEIVEDGVAGFLAPVGDAGILADKVWKLLKDKDLQQKFAINGREKIKQFSKEITAERILEVYLSVTRSV